MYHVTDKLRQVQVYRCDCWVHHASSADATPSSPAAHTIYFYDRLSLGSAAVSQARNGRELVDGETTVLDIQLQVLGLDGEALGCSVSHKELLELDGGPLAGWSFNRLDLSNIPRRDQASMTLYYCTRTMPARDAHQCLPRQAVACTGPSTASLELLAEVEAVNRKKSKKGDLVSNIPHSAVFPRRLRRLQ